jgi:hypothetical protein
LDLFISILYAQEKRLLAQRVDGFRSTLIKRYSRAWTKPIEKLARLSGRVAWKIVGALERRGYDIREKISAPIGRVPRRALRKPKSDD